MAKINFSLRGKANPSKIYVRFSASREQRFKLATPLTVNPKYFNSKTGKIKRVAEFKDKDELQKQLDDLHNYLITQYNDDVKEGKFNGVGWLQKCLDNFFNQHSKTDINFLHNYALHYVELLKIKHNDKTGKIGVSKTTITKYTTIAKKIKEFEQYKRRKYMLIDVNLKFRNDLLNYFLEVDNLGRNTAGRYLKFLKTICLSAKKEGLKTSPELEQIKGFSVKVDKIYLNFDELKQIENVQLSNERLNVARDWLIIGCYLGQRAGDLLQLTSANIVYNGTMEFIELVQQKTQKRVSIPLHPKIKEIINKRGGELPPQFCTNVDSAKTMFNRYIKDICKLADLTEPTQGAKVNPKTNRKETGIYPKYELVTSHICRRSFATNYYGDMPTALIMNVTGHSTEKEFLNYIGKTNIDYAQQMVMYWNLEQQKQNVQDGKQNPVKLTYKKQA